MWITNGMQADWCCLLANTSDGPVHKNKSLIMVPMDAPGISARRSRRSACIRATPRSCSSTTCACPAQPDRPGRRRLHVPDAAVPGRAPVRRRQQLLRWTRQLIDLTIEYTRQRHTFGTAHPDNQVVHFRLAELRTEVECCAR
jgi:citronellyl-CoA dehydrogenase